MGDVFFAIVNLSRFLHVQPELALTQTIKKFIKRFEYLEREINAMRGTLGWRVLERLRRSKFPFVAIFKKLIYIYSVITKHKK